MPLLMVGTPRNRLGWSCIQLVLRGFLPQSPKMDLPRALIESTGERLYSELKIMPNGQKLVLNLVGEVVILTNGPA
jgi:hypothetical protein